MSRKIVCLVGSSGSGKTKLEDELASRGYKILKSYTTREKRFEGENSRTFVSEEEFEKVRSNLVAYTLFDGHEYGATMEQIEKNDLYVVDPAGVEDLKVTVGRGNLFVVFLNVDARVCFGRMRMSRNEEHARERVKHDGEIFPKFTDYDMLIPNNDMDDFEMNANILQSVIHRWCKR
jgi:guanylate kinase